MTGGSQLPCGSLLDYCPRESWKWGVETSSEDGGSEGGGGGTGVGGLCPGGSWPSPPTLEPRGLSFMGLVGLEGPSCICLSFPTMGAGSLQPSCRDEVRRWQTWETWGHCDDQDWRTWPGHLDFRIDLRDDVYVPLREGLGQVQADGCPWQPSRRCWELLSLELGSRGWSASPGELPAMRCPMRQLSSLCPELHV